MKISGGTEQSGVVISTSESESEIISGSGSRVTEKRVNGLRIFGREGLSGGGSLAGFFGGILTRKF